MEGKVLMESIFIPKIHHSIVCSWFDFRSGQFYPFSKSNTLFFCFMVCVDEVTLQLVMKP